MNCPAEELDVVALLLARSSIRYTAYLFVVPRFMLLVIKFIILCGVANEHIVSENDKVGLD